MMKLSDFNYDLPDSLIADKPPAVRGQSRLLVLNKSEGSFIDRNYADLHEFLCPKDLIILNDTRVIKARIKAEKQNGAERELVILEKHSFDDDWHRHRVLYRRKLASGDILRVKDVELTVEEVLGDGIAVVKSDCDLLEIAEKYGEVPLPPYMHRQATSDDANRYQTVWAKEKGSVAAPTASLNMTQEIIEKLKAKGVKIAWLTLHVGLGTFLPIRTDDVEDHKMHQEYFEIPLETVRLIQQTRLAGGRVVAVGTTVTRTLEFAHELLQDEPKDLSGEADIFIYPGFQFKVVDVLLTNFHAPKSTVLMLTAAFAGWDKLLPAYQHAIEQKYYFFSYGDSMLIL